MSDQDTPNQPTDSPASPGDRSRFVRWWGAPGSSRRTLARNAMWNWGTYALNLVVLLVLSPFIVQHLGDHAFGVWILINALTGYMNFADFGIRPAIVHYVAKHDARGEPDAVNRYANSAFVTLLGGERSHLDGTRRLGAVHGRLVRCAPSATARCRLGASDRWHGTSLLAPAQRVHRGAHRQAALRSELPCGRRPHDRPNNRDRRCARLRWRADRVGARDHDHRRHRDVLQAAIRVPRAAQPALRAQACGSHLRQGPDGVRRIQSDRCCCTAHDLSDGCTGHRHSPWRALDHLLRSRRQDPHTRTRHVVERGPRRDAGARCARRTRRARWRGRLADRQRTQRAARGRTDPRLPAGAGRGVPRDLEPGQRPLPGGGHPPRCSCWHWAPRCRSARTHL